MNRLLVETVRLDHGDIIADCQSGNMSMIHDSFILQINDFLLKKKTASVKSAIILESDAPIFRILSNGTAIVSRVI